MTQERHILVWNNCLNFIRQNIDPNQFKTWFRPIKPVSLVESTLTVEVPSEFFREYVEGAYLEILKASLKKELGVAAKLVYVVTPVKRQQSLVYPAAHGNAPVNKTISVETFTRGGNPGPFVFPGMQRVQVNPQLNPVYCFENLIVGECNKMGFTAGESISQAPGKTAFNPLFLFGGPGLGKTHLAQAIGLEIKKNYPDKIVLYVTANRYMTQYMDAVTVKNKLTDFLNFYQMIDVLILDDVQEFAEKQGTQNAYFHIFNHLHQSGKQLILTSDKAPVDLMGLEQRLLSRFKWGLVTELKAPSYKTRLEILKNKSQKDGIELPEEVLNYLASKTVGSVRELEGTLVSLMAHATLSRETITMELAQRLTDQIVSESAPEITIESIQGAVCKYFGITREIMLSKTRKREIVQARQIAMYLGRSLTKTSLAAIGAQIGGKDHATVLHACNTVNDLIETDRNFKQYVSDIEKLLKVEE